MKKLYELRIKKIKKETYEKLELKDSMIKQKNEVIRNQQAEIFKLSNLMMKNRHVSLR